MKKQRFEHLVFECRDEDVAKNLKAIEKDGYELVSSVGLARLGYTIMMFFKRPVNLEGEKENE